MNYFPYIFCFQICCHLKYCGFDSINTLFHNKLLTLFRWIHITDAVFVKNCKAFVTSGLLPQSTMLPSAAHNFPVSRYKKYILYNKLLSAKNNVLQKLFQGYKTFWHKNNQIIILKDRRKYEYIWNTPAYQDTTNYRNCIYKTKLSK